MFLLVPIGTRLLYRSDLRAGSHLAVLILVPKPADSDACGNQNGVHQSEIMSLTIV